MSRKADPTIIGGFILGAAVLVVAGVAYFGSGQFLATKQKFVLYFSESLAGLTVGAPVNFRGVKVGAVTDIVVRYDTRDHSIRTPVYIEVKSDRFEDVGGGPRPTDAARIVDLMVERGLRAQLVIQSLVTGQLAVQFDSDPEAELNLVGADSEYIELPTIPSQLKELERTIANLPINELIAELRSAVRGVDEFVHSEDAKEAVRSLDKTLKEFGELASHIDDKVDPVAASVTETAEFARDALKRAADSIASAEVALNKTLEDTRCLVRNIDDQVEPVVSSFEAAAGATSSSLEQARKTLVRLDDVIAKDSELHYELVHTLEELSAAARSIRVLVDYLERHPEALLQGKGTPGGG